LLQRLINGQNQFNQRFTNLIPNVVKEETAEKVKVKGDRGGG